GASLRSWHPHPLRDPCRLGRQVKEFSGSSRGRSASPAGRAGRGRGEGKRLRSSCRTASPAGRAGRGREQQHIIQSRVDKRKICRRSKMGIPAILSLLPLLIGGAKDPAEGSRLAVIQKAPAFSLTDQDGKTVRSADLKGKALLV